MNDVNVIGVDIGGTKTLVGLVRIADGTILHSKLGPTNTESPVLFVQSLVRILRRFLRLDGFPKPVAIGIGTAGHIDLKGGTVSSLNLGLSKLPLKRLLSEAIGLPVFIDNDCNAGAIGELYYGAAQGKNHFAFLTVGTGVGVGLVLNGTVHHGKCNYAGEIGHAGIDIAGARCKCGGWGCLEDVASGPAIVESVKAELAEGSSSVLSKSQDFSTRDVFVAAQRQDPLCTKVVQHAIKALGYAIRSLNNLLDLELVVLGGGIPQAIPEEFARELPRYLEDTDNRVNLAPCPVVVSRLYPDSIVLGAARLAMERELV